MVVVVKVEEKSTVVKEPAGRIYCSYLGSTTRLNGRRERRAGTLSGYEANLLDWSVSWAKTREKGGQEVYASTSVFVSRSEKDRKGPVSEEAPW